MNERLRNNTWDRWRHTSVSGSLLRWYFFFFYFSEDFKQLMCMMIYQCPLLELIKLIDLRYCKQNTSHKRINTHRFNYFFQFFHSKDHLLFYPLSLIFTANRIIFLTMLTFFETVAVTFQISNSNPVIRLNQTITSLGSFPLM